MRELIVAVDRHGAVGSEGGLGFSCKEDMAWFKWYTMGKVLWCGKNTYPGIANLPGRDVRQLSREEGYPAGCYVGGGAVYQSVIDVVDRAVVTFLNTTVSNPDTFLDIGALDNFEHSLIVRDEAWGKVVIFTRYRSLLPNILSRHT